MKNVPFVLAAILMGICAVVIAWFYVRPVPETIAQENVGNATTTDLGVTSSVDTRESVSRSAVDSGLGVRTPDYMSPITYSNQDLTSEVRTQLNEKLKVVQNSLEASPLDLKAWVDIGTLHYMGGDYDFAKKAWLFVLDVQPNNATAAFNLASLYENAYKAYEDAERFYLLTIKASPTNRAAYTSLAVMYQYKFKTDTNAAEQILKQGITAMPAAVDLQVTLAQYYKEKGRIADAKAMYEKAIATAKSQGDQILANGIAEEAGRL